MVIRKVKNKHGCGEGLENRFRILMPLLARTGRTGVMWHRGPLEVPTYSSKDFIIRRYVFQTRIMAT